MRIFICVCVSLTLSFFHRIHFLNLSHYSTRLRAIIDYIFHFIQFISFDIKYHFFWSSFYRRFSSFFTARHHLLNLKFAWTHAHFYHQFYNDTTLIKKHEKCYEFNKSTTTSIDMFAFRFYSRF